jgi:N-acetylglucosamine-6-phosphate deacetylase
VANHLVGPWLSPELEYHRENNSLHLIPPDILVFKRLQRAAGGHIRLVTLAPELPGSEKFIHEVVRMGVEVSLGHTNASDADIAIAIAAGARFCTFFGKGVPENKQRHDPVMQRLPPRPNLLRSLYPMASICRRMF